MFSLYAASESQPLLNQPISQQARQKSLLKSFHWLLGSSRANLLLAFVPLGMAAQWCHWGSLSVFVLNFLAIVPLAKLLGDATEQVSMLLGPTPVSYTHL